MEPNLNGSGNVIVVENLWRTYDMGSEQQVHALRGVNLAEAGSAVEAFFARASADFLSLSAGDFQQVIDMALRSSNITATAS